MLQGGSPARFDFFLLLPHLQWLSAGWVLLPAASATAVASSGRGESPLRCFPEWPQGRLFPAAALLPEASRSKSATKGGCSARCFPAWPRGRLFPAAALLPEASRSKSATKGGCSAQKRAGFSFQPFSGTPKHNPRQPSGAAFGQACGVLACSRLAAPRLQLAELSSSRPARRSRLQASGACEKQACVALLVVFRRNFFSLSALASVSVRVRVAWAGCWLRQGFFCCGPGASASDRLRLECWPDCSMNCCSSLFSVHALMICC